MSTHPRRHRFSFSLKALLVLAAMLSLPPGWGAQFGRSEPPRLFRDREFTSASFAEAANHFVALGENAAVQELRGLAADGPADFSVNERIGWMCRVLFEGKTPNSLRPPGFGGLSLPRNTMPEKSWPLYPVALSGSTYFVLSEGYDLAGEAEDPKDYIDYCRKSGVFRKTKVVVPTKAQAQKDAASLRNSAPWKAIKWSDRGQEFGYTMSEQSIWNFVQNQADSIR